MERVDDHRRMNVVVRPVTPEDVGLVRSWRRRPELKAFSEEESDRPGEIIELDGQPVGWIDPHPAYVPAWREALGSQVGNEPWTLDLFVLPEHWGCGIGRSAIRIVSERSLAGGATSMVVNIARENEASSAAFRGAGWELIGTSGDELLFWRLRAHGVVLETERLVLRPMTAGDADEWWDAIWADDDVIRYLPPEGLVPRERMADRMSWVARHWEAHAFGIWSVRDRETAAFLGHVGLLSDPPDVELMYAIGRRHQGIGLAGEAVSRVVRFAFVELGLQRIVAIVYPDNVASVRVLEKLGATPDGTVELFGRTMLRYVITDQ
jgi:ribosomal-protein-alanine N-acetyltransferase